LPVERHRTFLGRGDGCGGKFKKVIRRDSSRSA
jgi:hypothetical protein